MRLPPLSAFLALLSGLAGSARAGTTLSKTELYAETARDCRTLSLSAWQSPARAALVKFGAKIDKAEACNQGKLLIITVGLRADPQSPGNAKVFDRLYARVAEANGWHPYALVDETDGVVVNVSVKNSIRHIDISIQSYEGE